MGEGGDISSPSQLFNILLAARDTTASLLTFVIYVLCLYPNVATKLRDEVLLYIPRGAPTFEHIRRMKYCAFSQFEPSFIETQESPFH